MLIASFYRRICSLLRRRNLESDFQEEIRQHLELKIQANIARGMLPEEATRQAHLEFGNPTLAKEHTSHNWGFPLLESVAQDFRMETRQLRRQKGFALVAMLTLTLGIGINVAVFSLVNAILLAPLPYPHSDLLVDVAETAPAQGIGREEVSYPNFLEFMRRSHSFSKSAAYASSTYTLRGGGAPERVSGSVVSASLFSILGGTLEAGVGFTTEDDQPGGSKNVILSHALWRRRFGADPAIIGKTILVDDDLYTVTGIMNTGFRFPSTQTDLWLSLGPLAGQSFMQKRGVHILSVLARLKDGASVRQAGAELQAIAATIQRQFPTEDSGHGANVVPLKEVLVRNARPALLMLSGSVLFVLLIASANIGSLLLSRVTARSREMAVRKALGATRARILQQLLTESLLLSILGAIGGLLLAKSVLMLASEQLATLLPRMEEVRIDSQVLFFALLLSLVTGVLFGMAPALHSAQPGGEGEVCKSTIAGATGSKGSHLLPRTLIVAEIAVTLLLLVSAGLLMKSFARVLQVDRGFDSDNLLTMTVSLPSTNYQTGEQVAQFFDRVKSVLEAMPGVREVSGSSELPMSGGDSYGELTIEGQTFSAGEAPAASFRRIFPNYFHSLKIPIVQGRIFRDSDDGRRQLNVIVNQSLAHHFWPNAEALGKRIKVGPAASEPWLTIVGVVGDVRNERLDAGPRFATYEPYQQRPRDSITLIIRTLGEPTKLALASQDVVRNVDKNVVLYDVDTMEHRIADLVYPRRLLTSLSGGFALMALVLAAIGLYGVLSSWVGQRTREIGIRMALGAAKADVLKGVMAQGFRLVIVGLVLGLMGAVAATRFMTSLLFSVTALDFGVFVATMLVITIVAAIAAYLPARRATEVDPMVALRYE